MKKLVLAMACVLSLGLLASCKQGTQDVNVKNSADSEKTAFAGTVSLSATPVYPDTTDKAWKATAAANDAFSVGPQFATIEWESGAEKVDTNFSAFTLKFNVDYNSDTTSTTYNPVYDEATIKFIKVGDKYYTYSKNVNANGTVDSKVELTVTGNPKEGKFTIDGSFIASLDSNTAQISQIKFEK